MSQHVIPLNDIREHGDEDCFCHPDLIEDGVYVHHALDGREFLERLDLRCGDIPLFLSQVSRAWFTNSRDADDENIVLAMKWLDRRETLLLNNPLIQDTKGIALSNFIESFFEFDNDAKALETIIDDLQSVRHEFKPIHYFKLAKIFELPVMLLLDKTQDNLIVDKPILTLLAIHAYKNDFISFSKVSELLCLNADETRAAIKDFKDD